MIIKFFNNIIFNYKFPHVTTFNNQYPSKASNKV